MQPPYRHAVFRAGKPENDFSLDITDHPDLNLFCSYFIIIFLSKDFLKTATRS